MNIVTKLRFSIKITGIVLSLPQFIQTKMIKISNTEHLNDNNKIDLNNNEKTKTKNNENELIDLFDTKLTIKDKYFESMDIVGAAKYLLSCKNCIFMTGAGISTSV